MDITVSCPRCGQVHNIRSTTLGRIKRCDNCGAKFPVEDVDLSLLSTARPRAQTGCAGMLLLLIAVVTGAWWAFRPKEKADGPPHIVNGDCVEEIPVEKDAPKVREDPVEKAEQDAARLLDLARSLEDRARVDKKDAARLLGIASRRYAELVETYPNTAAAVEARQALKRLTDK